MTIALRVPIFANCSRADVGGSVTAVVIYLLVYAAMNLGAFGCVIAVARKTGSAELSSFGGLNHGSGFVELASNPYAAMPSLHSADALIVGVVMAALVRRSWAKALWLAWPTWVWFAVIATGNHFWLDVVAGIALAVAAGAIVYRRQLRRALTH